MTLTWTWTSSCSLTCSCSCSYSWPRRRRRRPRARQSLADPHHSPRFKAYLAPRTEVTEVRGQHPRPRMKRKSPLRGGLRSRNSAAPRVPSSSRPSTTATTEPASRLRSPPPEGGTSAPAQAWDAAPGFNRFNPGCQLSLFFGLIPDPSGPAHQCQRARLGRAHGVVAVKADEYEHEHEHVNEHEDDHVNVHDYDYDYVGRDRRLWTSCSSASPAGTGAGTTRARPGRAWRSTGGPAPGSGRPDPRRRGTGS